MCLRCYKDEDDDKIYLNMADEKIVETVLERIRNGEPIFEYEVFKIYCPEFDKTVEQEIVILPHIFEIFDQLKEQRWFIEMNKGQQEKILENMIYLLSMTGDLLYSLEEYPQKSCEERRKAWINDVIVELNKKRAKLKYKVKNES